MSGDILFDIMPAISSVKSGICFCLENGDPESKEMKTVVGAVKQESENGQQ